MDNETQDVLKGTLDMLMLKALQLEPMHGWGIGERIAQLSHGVFRLQTGTLSGVEPAPATRLDCGGVANDGQRPPCALLWLTASGRKQLEAERASWSVGDSRREANS